MKLSYKISFVFIMIFILSVGSSIFAIREMLFVSDSMKTDITITMPSREVLVAMQERIENMLNLKRQLLAPYLTFAERAAYVKQYKDQEERLQRERDKLDSLFAVSNLPDTQKHWQAFKELLATWEQSNARMQQMVRQWHESGIASTEKMEQLMRQFEREQSNLLLLLEKFLDGTASPADKQKLMTSQCVMQQWWNRFNETRALYKGGRWDGIRPQRLSDGSYTVDIARNDKFAAIMQDMEEDHTAFHAALDKAKVLLRNKDNAKGPQLLAACMRHLEHMREHFRQIYAEISTAEHLVAEAQKLEKSAQDFQPHIRAALEGLLVSNAEELDSRGASAVNSVERSILDQQLLLGLFVVFCVMLAMYIYNTYRKNQHDIERLYKERETAFTQMHFLFNTFPVGCVVRDSEYNLRNCNLAAARLFGLEEQWEEMEENALAFGLENKWEYLERFAALVSPEFQPDGTSSAQEARELFQRAFAEGAVKTEWMYRTSDGDPLPTEITLLRTEWEGKPAVVYHIRDLREEKALRLAEEVSREYIRVLFEEAPIGCQIRNADGIIQDCNKTMYALVGARDKKEFLDRYDEIMPKYQPCGRLSSELVQEKLEAVLTTGYQHFEWRHQRLDGEIVESEVTLVRVMLQGKPAVACYVQDMSAIKAMLVERDEANQRTRMLFDNAPFSCHIRDNWGNIKDCNAETLRLFGLKSKDVFREHFSDLSPAVQPNGQTSEERLAMMQCAALETGYQSFRWEHLTSEGKTFPAEMTFIRVAWAGADALACYMRPLHNERRNAVRHQLLRSCTLDCHSAGGDKHSLFLADISLSGVRLKGNVGELHMDQIIDLSCAQPPFDAVFKGARGRVCWLSATETGVMLERLLDQHIERIVQQFNDGSV